MSISFGRRAQLDLLHSYCAEGPNADDILLRTSSILMNISDRSKIEIRRISLPILETEGLQTIIKPMKQKASSFYLYRDPVSSCSLRQKASFILSLYELIHALWGRRPHAFLMLINVYAASIHFFLDKEIQHALRQKASLLFSISSSNCHSWNQLMIRRIINGNCCK